MGETACVLHAFNFPSYETKQGNQLDPLQDSISFGRFATESLAWDKWSTFSNKRYVEEAAKHSQPGLVAKKKAFFEAYYKKKALLQKQNDAAELYCTQELDTEAGNLNVSYPSSKTVTSELDAQNGGDYGTETSGIETILLEKDSEKPNIYVQEGPALKAEAVDVTQQELPKLDILTCSEQNEHVLRGLKICQEVSEVTTRKVLPACPQPPSFPRASSKRSHSVKGPRVSFGSFTEVITFRNIETDTAGKLQGHASSKIEGLPASKAGQMPECLATTILEIKRTRTLFNGPASKGTKSRTDVSLSPESSKACSESKSPIISNPIDFRTGKETEKKVEEPEEILKSKASKKVQFQIKIKDKAASQLKKLRLSFCFSSWPSSDMLDQSDTPKNQKKIFLACFQPEKHNTSMKNGCWKQVEKHRSQRQVRPGSLGEVIGQKGKSPIVQIL